jgi:uncharacterized protein YxjI
MREKLVAFGDDYYIQNEAGQKMFKVDGKVLRVRDTYGVEVAPDQEDVLILAVTVALDQMAHN